MSAWQPPDQAARELAVAERRRNVVVDAGAGTGKTTLLVSRLVGLVAPDDPRAQALELSRIAAITFTRRAAGDLRLRIRERLLCKLADPCTSARQREQLHAALGAVDTAFVGTIHSFADRLLRMRPREARLSPDYEIAEDVELLERETFERLMHGAETGALRSQLHGVLPAEVLEEAEETVLLGLEAGLRADDEVHEHYTKFGIQGLVIALIGQRDVGEQEVPLLELDFDRFRRAAREYIELVGALDGDSIGVRRMRIVARRLRELLDTGNPAHVYREVNYVVDRYLEQPKMRQREEFARDRAAIAAWKAYDKGVGRDAPLRDDLLGPLHRWIAHRLARLRPVVLALYEQVKSRHRVVDHIDLLLRLRDLLRDDKQARRDYQRLFDHVFVDELQDTDPLQAEVITYLCEAEPRADHWHEAELAPGKLTIVGDPKQSIYRFRRADIAMYDEARSLVLNQGGRDIEIRTNFRSTRTLIEWLNHRFTEILGESPSDGRAFDPAEGRVYQRPLEPSPSAAHRPSVHAVCFDSDGDKADEARQLEADVVPRYLRWLVERSGVEITDPVTGELRPVRYGDIAVLAVSTMHLPLLFAELDALYIPYASRGGTLFLQDALHRQFLLGLRALADPNDGIAEAALLRVPFFALDVRDLALDRAARRGLLDESDEQVRRVRRARAQVRELRQKRFTRSPGDTARALLEQTAFARTVAMGPNGAQRLARLRELCHVLEQRAAQEHLDFDAVTAELRRWVESPVQLDPPHPVGTEAVHIMTVHQAKGLEFPVVLLWDHRCMWNTRGEGNVPWRVDRDGHGWMIDLSRLFWKEPPGLGLKQREKAYRDAERQRVAYVAATRSRDLLAVPYGGPDDGKWIGGTLLADDPDAHVTWLDTYGYEKATNRWWEVPDDAPRAGDAPPPDVDETDLEIRWADACREAERDRFRPVGVRSLADAKRADDPAETTEGGGAPARRLLNDDETPRPPKPAEGRHGATFGTAVHRALELLLGGHVYDSGAAVERTAAHVGLTDQLAEARADVERAMRALRAEGLLDRDDVALRLEYPLAAPREPGLLVGGYIDLLAATPEELLIIDFKTDAPPAQGEVPPPQYIAQVRTYGEMLAPLAAGRTVRPALLFTADGSMWRA